ncbi:P-loop containing nucleoside triphosphate hydrolase protein [Lasiosphaeria miniovina]|uniref:RNA helicase n=1 Tax=Lasiosphaeria miniovina TaxID=1954250 RepID=A0AA40ED59_9PEZI|nr:P-loop containing nucleoside triphosphate hydrolase protein [Lasiosphaeria miniovina]KAK0733071.1 P-loop containing nucleoside triphosphate hydrolase protein [Lasiosphaeria miniovina]
MSSGKKHSRGEGDEQNARASKKAKTDAPVNGDVKVKKEKKETKYKKAKLEREEKRAKKEKKEKVRKGQSEEQTEEQPEEQTEEQPEEQAEIQPDEPEVEADAPAPDSDTAIAPAAAVAVEAPESDAEAEAEPKPSKKEKKDKKDKKDQKEKKEKREKKEKKEKKDKPKKSKSAKDAITNIEVQSAESNGSAAIKSAPSPSPSGPAQRNGATYVYKESAALSAVSEADVEGFLTKQEISLFDPLGVKLRPILLFDQLPHSALLAKKPFGAFTAPTPIQAASWASSLSGRDVIGIAETGSGKTLAFSLPCVEALASKPKPKREPKDNDRTAHARAVIVSPTRELAMQTHAAIAPLAALVGLSAVCLFGGASKDEQRAQLRRNTGADIVVATPGRLKDFLNEGCVSLDEAMFAVLDEADRMLDKGFEDDIRMILGCCPAREKRQTLMFTATWPIDVQGLAEGFMVDPVRVTIGNRPRGGGDEEGGGGRPGNGTVELQANSRIEQKVEVVDPRGKEQRLLELLKEATKGSAKDHRVLVFCLYKKEAMRVEQFLERRGIRVASIHGDLRQEQRTRSLEAFKSGTTTVLVATDVAARGLDIPEVKLVINVTFPLTIEDYVHRIGRTGRAGKTGKAITLFTEHDKAHSGSLVNILRAAKQEVPEELLKFGGTVKKKGHDAYGAFYKDVDLSKKATKITFD